ncbi:MAG: hypothetical protein JNK32_10075 [Anaerolineales bacterium]|nr:hypothetical protein [Anaerolineales bacterium]
MNELTRQGVSYFESGDESKALECFIESLRHEPDEVDTWFWLAMTLDSLEERERCMRQALRADPQNAAARKGLTHLANGIESMGEHPGEQHKPVSVPVAGVNYKKRQSAVKNLRANEQVFLRREPYNPYDPSAIRVETSSGQQIGYIPKEVAQALAPYLDDASKLMSARVVGLQTGAMENQPVSVKIAFYVPRTMQLPAHTHEQIEYFYDDSGNHAYILLNCTEVDLDTVKTELQKDGMQVLHSGVGSRMASNGRFYQWFIRIGTQEGADTHQRVSLFFERVFGILSNESRIKQLEADRQALQDALAQAQHDRDQLKKEKDTLFERNLDYVKNTDRLRGEVVESEQKIKRKDAEILLLNMELAQRDAELDDVQKLARIAARRFRRGDISS